MDAVDGLWRVFLGVEVERCGYVVEGMAELSMAEGHPDN